MAGGQEMDASDAALSIWDVRHNSRCWSERRGHYPYRRVFSPDNNVVNEFSGVGEGA